MEYGSSESRMSIMWEQSLESGGVFAQSMARVSSAILTVVNVEEYDKSMARVWPTSRIHLAFTCLVALPTAARATRPGVRTVGSSRLTTFPKSTTLGSSLNVFSLVLTAVECSSSLSRYSSIQVHSNEGGFDELNFCALRVREWTCVCECAVSVCFMLTSSGDLFPTKKGSATTYSKVSCFYKVTFTL